MIVDLACYSILTGSTAYQHFPTYAFKSPVLTKKVYSDSYICEFLRNDINEYKIQAFFDSWVKENNNNGTILISYKRLFLFYLYQTNRKISSNNLEI